MGILSRLFGSRQDRPDLVVIMEVDIESDEYKQNPWTVPWESDSLADDST